MILLLCAALASAAPRIDLYSMGPGDELFSRFGHSAICVETDEKTRCYNYGSTSMEPRRLVVGFVRATAAFEVTRTSLDHMLEKYAVQDRRVWRQHLPLSDEQASELAERLARDARPENKYYMYDHFVDNCTTRIRDHIDVVTGGALSRRTKDVLWDRTLRDAVREGLSPDLPVAAGIEMVTGSYIDHVPTVWDAMFLPDVLRSQVERSLSAIPVEIASATHERPSRWPLIGPALLAGGGVAWALVARAAGRWGRIASAIIATIVGVLLWVVTIAAVAPSFRANLAAAFFWPTDLLLLWPRVGRGYAVARAGVIVAIVALSLIGIVKQSLIGPAVLGAGLLAGAVARRR